MAARCIGDYFHELPQTAEIARNSAKSFIGGAVIASFCGQPHVILAAGGYAAIASVVQDLVKPLFQKLFQQRPLDYWPFFALSICVLLACDSLTKAIFPQKVIKTIYDHLGAVGYLLMRSRNGANI